MPYPPVAQVRVLTDRVVKVVIQRAKAIYARADEQAIGLGDTTVVVTFPTPLPSADYVIAGLSLYNSATDDPFLSCRPIGTPGQTGFTVQLSAPAPSSTYVLQWAIGELYNP